MHHLTPPTNDKQLHPVVPLMYVILPFEYIHLILGRCCVYGFIHCYPHIVFAKIKYMW